MTPTPPVHLVQEQNNKEAQLAQVVIQEQHSAGLQALRRLLTLQLGQAQASLLRCQLDEFPAKQARAYLLDKMLKAYWPEV